MPSLVFLMCAEGCAVDKDSNLLSVFKVLEQINFQEHEVPPEGYPEGVIPVATAIPVTIIAHVAREESDLPDQEFECLFWITGTDGVDMPIIKSHFVFKRPRHRFILQMKGLMPSKPGTIFIGCGVQKAGTEELLFKHSYPIEVIKIEQPEEALPDIHAAI